VAIAAHFKTESNDPGSPRAHRRTLLLEALGATAGGDTASVTVQNISQTGLLLESETELAVGETIEFDLPEVEVVEARVVWASGRLAGCQFIRPLTTAALSAAQLRGAVAGAEPAASTARSSEPFPQRLGRLRKARGLTLASIAQTLGVSKPTVWAWEQGKAKPVENRLEALAEILGVTREELTPDSGSLRFDDSLALTQIIARSRLAIAQAVGIKPERVKISVEL
jgi:transcriptional regulator with XRE-family HTH domain